MSDQLLRLVLVVLTGLSLSRFWAMKPRPTAYLAKSIVVLALAAFGYLLETNEGPSSLSQASLILGAVCYVFLILVPLNFFQRASFAFLVLNEAQKKQKRRAAYIAFALHPFGMNRTILRLARLEASPDEATFQKRLAAIRASGNVSEIEPAEWFELRRNPDRLARAIHEKKPRGFVGYQTICDAHWRENDAEALVHLARVAYLEKNGPLLSFGLVQAAVAMGDEANCRKALFASGLSAEPTLAAEWLATAVARDGRSLEAQEILWTAFGRNMEDFFVYQQVGGEDSGDMQNVYGDDGYEEAWQRVQARSQKLVAPWQDEELFREWKDLASKTLAQIPEVPAEAVTQRFVVGPVAKALLAINILVFVAELPGGSTDPENLIRMGAMIVDWEFVREEPWRLLTASFLHFGFLHIAFNMWALRNLGAGLETRVGKFRFLALYLLSGLAAMFSVLQFGQPGSMVVGASGSVMGLVGVLLFESLSRYTRDKGSFNRRGLVNILTVVALQTAIDLSSAEISFAAHAGGLVSGFVFAALLGVASARTSSQGASATKGH